MISEGDEDVATTMKRITVSYVYYFNKKYARVVHLFQDRFRSEAIEGDSYLISLVRYIHQNPVKATMVKTADEYKWSSCNSYLNKDNLFTKLLDLELYSSDREKAIKLLAKDLNVQSLESFLDLQEEKVLTEEATNLSIRKLFSVTGLNKDKINQLLKS